MNTPTHVLIGLAALSRRGDPGRSLAAFAGGLAPDLPLFAMVGIERWLLGTPMGTIWGQRYFASFWRDLIDLGHSFPVLGLVAALGCALGLPRLRVFAYAALLHAACDLLTHHDDAHRHFWPLSDWRFASPVSYWDPAHYGRVFRWFEAGLAVALTLLLIRRHQGWLARGALGLTLAAYAGGILYFALIF